MGMIAWLLSIVGTVIGGIALGLVKDEVAGQLPRLNTRIIRAAARNVPPADQQMRAEEWARHIEDCPGKLSQLAAATSIYRASLAMREYSSQFVRRRVSICLLVLSLQPIIDQLLMLRDLQNWWVINFVGLANLYFSVAAIWACYWLIHLKPYVVGERQPTES